VNATLRGGLGWAGDAFLQTLSDGRVPVLSIVCEPCGRASGYDVERLMSQYGWDAKLTDLLPALVADCPKRVSVSVYDRRKAVYEMRG
jgi:hypothetical protein